LQINCNTWTLNQNLLFDYESDDRSSFSLSTDKNGLIYKDENRLYCFDNIKKLPSKKLDFISKVNTGEDYYEIRLKDRLDDPNDQEISWLIIREAFDASEPGYRLKEGDTIKVGKIMLKVREIKTKCAVGTMIESKKDEKNYQKIENCEDYSVNLNPSPVGNVLNERVNLNLISSPDIVNGVVTTPSSCLDSNFLLLNQNKISHLNLLKKENSKKVDDKK
jgi:hypothetical protein